MKEQKKNQAGITLIALVISIIVMLILAGVSLNAMIGDNGIISQAQNAKMQSGMVALEEWLQEEYVRYYVDDSSDYNTKIELLADKDSKLFLKDGSKSYITYNGNIYYLINKNNLPNDIKNSLIGGDSTEYYQYMRLIDVYGVTRDLKVYYCSNGLTDTIYGTIEDVQQDPDSLAVRIGKNSELKNVVIDALSTFGIEVDNGNITVGQASQIKELTISKTQYPNLTSLEGISDLRNLRKLTLTDLNLENLSGIESCIYLEYLMVNNTRIRDYSALSTSLNLKYLYLNRPVQDDVNNLVVALKDSPMSKLEYLAIRNRTTSVYWKEGDRLEDTNTKSTVNDISGLSQLPSNIQKSIQYLYLNDNAFSSVGSLLNFTNVIHLDLRGNQNLVNIVGIENMANLDKLVLNHCTSLADISPVKDCSGIKELFIDKTAVSKIFCSSKTQNIYAYGCNLNDLSYLADNTYIKRLELKNNLTLVNVANLKQCSGIRSLYLDENVSMNAEDVVSIENIFLQCGTDYSLPDKYLKYFSSVVSYDYSNTGLDDYSEEILALKNRSNITSLKLYNNPNLSKSRILKQYQLGNIKKAELDTIITNLDLTQSQVNYITNLKTYTNEQLELLTDAQIEALEEENDIYFRYILSTLTGVKTLNLEKIGNVKNADFLGKMKSLNSLALYDTGITDLGVLEDNQIPITGLSVNNKDLTFSNIQSIISNCGLSCTNAQLLQKLNGCKNITKIAISNGGNYGTIDLKDCSSLKTFSTGGNHATKYIFPASLESCSRTWTSGCYDDFSRCTYIKKISYLDSSVNNNTDLARLCECFSKISCEVEEIDLMIGFSTSLENLGNSISFDLHKLYITSRTWWSSGNQKWTGLSSFGNITALRDLELVYGDIGDISWVSSLTNLTRLELYNNKITNLSGIENLSNLQTLHLSNNSIFNLKPLENMNSLVNIYLNENQIENTINIKNEDESISIINNIEILKNLKNKGTLKILEMKSNPLTDDSELKALNWKGGHYYGL